VDTEPLDDRRILPLVVHLARLGSRAAEQHAAGCLRPRQLVALTLLAERGALGQQSLGEDLRLDPSNVVGLLNELEERGLVTRRRDPADRRRHIVELSPTGHDELARANAQLREVEDALLTDLSDEERATMRALLVRAIGTATRGYPGPAICARDDPADSC
jgi:DNA-binding MarR family transcriptional regulator